MYVRKRNYTRIDKIAHEWVCVCVCLHVLFKDELEVYFNQLRVQIKIRRKKIISSSYIKGNHTPLSL